jgi:cell division protein FtsB
MKLTRAGIITKIVIFALLVYASVTLINLRAQVDSAQEAQEALRQLVEEKEISNAELEYKIEHSEDDETIADIARDELNLVAPGEKIFFDSGG